MFKYKLQGPFHTRRIHLRLYKARFTLNVYRNELNTVVNAYVKCETFLI